MADTYTIDWGDGSHVEHGVPADRIQTHSWKANGTYFVLVTNERTGKTTTIKFVVTDVEDHQTNQPPHLTATVTDASTWEVTMTTDQAEHLYDIDWGDGVTESSVTLSAAGRKHNYPRPEGASQTYTITAKRLDTAMSSTTTIIVEGKIPDLTVTLTSDKSKRIYTLQTDNPGATYKIDWGDGSPVETVTIPAAGVSHTYTADGAKTIKVTNTVTNKTGETAQDVVGVAPDLTAFVSNQQTFEVTVETDQL